MANWISSKLKAAESILQQIDQQAAESLGKADRPQSPSDRPVGGGGDEIRGRSDPAVPLKHQLPSRPSPRDIRRPPPLPPLPSAAGSSEGHRRTGADPGQAGIADGDWTELLSSPVPAASRPIADSLKKLGPAPTPGRRLQPGKRRVASQESRGGGDGEIGNGAVADRAGGASTETEALADDSGLSADLGSLAVRQGPAKSSPGSHGESETETDSASSSDSEEERRRREERRKRRERILVEKAAAAAVEAIRDREDLVTRLEGEKQGLVKILEEREKQQAQEALELQVSMVETMEAVEQEKQKHNSTRMEALACLAMLETSNSELANLLATTQWNLELEVNRVAELRQQLESKELTQKEHNLRMSKIHQSPPSVESSKRSELEMEILDAEHSFICDKISKLKDKAKKLEENIEVARRETVHPTEVEIELKKRLSQLTDRLIQKQGQVEALSSEKATMLFRIETASRLPDENGSSIQTSDFANYSDMGVAGSSARIDIEAGISVLSKSASTTPFPNRMAFRKQQLGSILQQLDAIFSAGLLLLKRSRTVQLWSLIYLLCLHLWVMYILMSHPKVSDSASHGLVYSLETINKTTS